jgi:hypothetical protein
MESTSFFETKISLSPKDLNGLLSRSTEDILIEKVKAKLENKCTTNGFVLPGSLRLVSRSVGYFEPARFTGDAVYYVKSEGKVLYPADGVKVIATVIRKNKMGMYVVHRDAIRIQIPRDLHLGNEEYEEADIGDNVEVELKRSKFQVNDTFILATGKYIRTVNSGEVLPVIEEKEEEVVVGTEESKEEEEEQEVEETQEEEEEEGEEEQEEEEEEED